jgi:hypothetical protein
MLVLVEAFIIHSYCWGDYTATRGETAQTGFRANANAPLYEDWPFKGIPP